MAAQAVNLDQARDRGLLRTGRTGLPGASLRPGRRATAGRRPGEQLLTNSRVHDLGIGITQRREVVAPAARNRLRILEVLFIQPLDGTRVAPEKGRRGQLFLEGITHVVNNLEGS